MMNLVADIEGACAQAKIGSEHAGPITSLLMKVIAEGLDGVEDQRNPSIDHVNSLKNCLTCVESPTYLQSIACEDLANNVDPELFGARKSRVDIISFVEDNQVVKALLVEGKLGCAVNEAGKNTQPTHTELREKFEWTCLRLSKLKCQIPVVDILHLLVSDLYKSQIARRVFMWRNQGLIPRVRCLCCHEFMEELGLPDSRHSVVGCAI